MFLFDLVFNSLRDGYYDLAHYVDMPVVSLVLGLAAVLVALSLLRLRR